MNYEQTFLGSCLQDGANIDLAIQDGLVPACFTTDDRRDIWGALLVNRTEGRQTDTTGIFMQMGAKCPSEELDIVKITYRDRCNFNIYAMFCIAIEGRNLVARSPTGC